MIKVSAPCKVHLLGEHAVVYGKPALLTTVGLRVAVTLNEVKGILYSSPSAQNDKLRKIIELIIKKELGIKNTPPYEVKIESKIPIGSGLGSSAAVSASYIAALLLFLKIKWDLNLINKLTYEAEKVFHGNPSGADNSTIVYGGLIWYRKETLDLKLIQPLPFSIPAKLADNFVLINTGEPKETTKDMVLIVKDLYEKKPAVVDAFLDSQEKLVRNLLEILKNNDEEKLIKIIREGEKNLESIGVCSPQVKKLIRQIEKAGGAAKICGAGGIEGPTGIILAYHPQRALIEEIAKKHNLHFFTPSLGVEGLRQE